MITSPPKCIYLVNVLLENDGNRFRLLERGSCQEEEWARVEVDT
jgi:hypothetical protein